MTDNTIFFRHYEAVVEGLVPGLKCIDDEHSFMHPFVNSDTQSVYYECLECNYRITPGILTANTLRKELNEALAQKREEEVSEL